MALPVDLGNRMYCAWYQVQTGYVNVI